MRSDVVTCNCVRNPGRHVESNPTPSDDGVSLYHMSHRSIRAGSRARRLRSLRTFAEPGPEPEAQEPAQAEPGAVSPKMSIITILHGSTPRITVAGMSLTLQHRHVKQDRVACLIAHVLFWAHFQDTCWKHFKNVEREASDSYWYLVTSGCKCKCKCK